MRLGVKVKGLVYLSYKWEERDIRACMLERGELRLGKVSRDAGSSGLV